MDINSETVAVYHVQPHLQERMDNEVIEKALGILRGRLVTRGCSMSSPHDVRDFLQLKMADLEHEVFACSFLDAQNRLIAHEELFRGTLTQTAVYPREVVKLALAHNASAVVFAHNHPSGVAEPSRADESLTTQLKSALALVDVRVLDHFIVAGDEAPMSFAERGLI